MDIVRDLFEPGREAFELSMLEMALRAFLIYLFAIVIVRLGSHGLWGKARRSI